MIQNNNKDTSIADKIIHGRIEPYIYAFSTKLIPNYLKVGETQRAVGKRLSEWQLKYEDLKEKFTAKAALNEHTYFRDYTVHEFLINEKKRARLHPEEFPHVYYSNEFFKDATEQDLKDAIKDIKESMRNIPLLNF